MKILRGGALTPEWGGSEKIVGLGGGPGKSVYFKTNRRGGS